MSAGGTEARCEKRKMVMNSCRKKSMSRASFRHGEEGGNEDGDGNDACD